MLVFFRYLLKLLGEVKFVALFLDKKIKLGFPLLSLNMAYNLPSFKGNLTFRLSIKNINIATSISRRQLICSRINLKHKS
jgi:hypothetical protein